MLQQGNFSTYFANQNRHFLRAKIHESMNQIFNQVAVDLRFAISAPSASTLWRGWALSRSSFTAPASDVITAMSFYVLAPTSITEKANLLVSHELKQRKENSLD